jgi:hypothetical protein
MGSIEKKVSPRACSLSMGANADYNYCRLVKAILEETEQVLTLCGTKRDS